MERLQGRVVVVAPSEVPGRALRGNGVPARGREAAGVTARRGSPLNERNVWSGGVAGAFRGASSALLPDTYGARNHGRPPADAPVHATADFGGGKPPGSGGELAQ